jgi:hypothetical protein
LNVVYCDDKYEARCFSNSFGDKAAGPHTLVEIKFIRCDGRHTGTRTFIWRIASAGAMSSKMLRAF